MVKRLAGDLSRMIQTAKPTPWQRSWSFKIKIGRCVAGLEGSRLPNRRLFGDPEGSRPGDGWRFAASESISAASRRRFPDAEGMKRRIHGDLPVSGGPGR
jgi:hypothetical protein